MYKERRVFEIFEIGIYFSRHVLLLFPLNLFLLSDGLWRSKERIESSMYIESESY